MQILYHQISTSTSACAQSYIVNLDKNTETEHNEILGDITELQGGVTNNVVTN